MYRGTVCIAGYSGEHTCICPILPPPGIPESALIKGGKPIIFPFAVIQLDLFDQKPQPPHTEDWLYDPDSVSFIRPVKDRKAVLDWSLFDSINNIFEQPIHDDFGFYVMDCEGTRSLGTVQPLEVYQVIYEEGEEGNWDYRIIFTDKSGKRYRLKITDLTWHYYCDYLRSPNNTPIEIGAQLTELLRSREVYLRIGLSRGWKKFPDRCYLQINGVYTFPDYLNGKTFLDFAPYKVSSNPPESDRH